MPSRRLLKPPDGCLGSLACCASLPSSPCTPWRARALLPPGAAPAHQLHHPCAQPHVGCPLALRGTQERLALEISRLSDGDLGDDETAKREFMAAHHRANEALKKSGIDVTLSGSTAVTCLKRGRRLLVANVGDSRAVLGRADPSGRIVAKDLSIDQKPDAPAERARIEGGGGQVHPSIVPGAGYVGPARVWDPSRRFGLACSRSMGDTVYYGPNRSGVIAEPEVTTHRLDHNDKLVIVGSDGIWDRISSQEAVEIARTCRDVEQVGILDIAYLCGSRDTPPTLLYPPIPSYTLLPSYRRAHSMAMLLLAQRHMHEGVTH